MRTILSISLITGMISGCAGVQSASRDVQLARPGGQLAAWDAFLRAHGDGHRTPAAAPPTRRWLLAADRPARDTYAGLFRSAAAAETPGAAQALAASETDRERPAGRRSPLPGLVETVARDLRHAPEDLWADTRQVYGRGPNLLILGLTYGGSLAMQQTGVDDSIEDTLGDGRIYSGDVADAIGALGNPALHFGVAGLWYLVGQQRQDERTYEIGRTLISALTINGVTTLLGQAMSADRSPNGEFGTFPSGHTSSTFTFASVMHQAYGPWVGAPLYALGVAVAAERLDDREHYFSDVIMGAVMGLVIGHTVAGEHELELFGGQIVPYADPATGASGVAWHVSF